MRQDLAFGQRVEKLAAAAVLPRVFVGYEIVPVGDKLSWRRHGVDFLIKGSDETLFIEVKGDRAKTGNVVIEKGTTPVSDSPYYLGWLYSSKADYVLYHILTAGKVYIIDLAELRNRIDNGTIKSVVKSTNSGWGITTFYVIKQSLLEEFCPVLSFDEKEWDELLNTHGVTI